MDWGEVVVSAMAVLILMSIVFMVAVLRNNNNIVDIIWGIGYIFITFVTNSSRNFDDIGKLILFLLVSIWGLRLSFHIAIRVIKRGKDIRYQNWRKDWGKMFYLKSFFYVFLLQGVLMFIISLPIVFANSSEVLSLGIMNYVGGFLWVIGMFFEVVGDFQLSNFKKNPKNKGKIITYGLWKYTRHPNYFGEICLWWGIALFCFGTAPLWTIVLSIVVTTFLILKVSGILVLENYLLQYPQFELYKKRTSKLIPWFPKRIMSKYKEA